MTDAGGADADRAAQTVRVDQHQAWRGGRSEILDDHAEGREQLPQGSARVTDSISCVVKK